MRHRCHIHVTFGGQRRRTCLSAVVALAVSWGCHQQARFLAYQKGKSLGLTSFSAFSFFKASMACISRMDSSTFPCSPAEPSQFSNYSINTTAFPLAETSEGERNGIGQTIDLDLFRSSLNCQFDFRDFAHLESYMISVSVLNFASWLPERKGMRTRRLRPRKKDNSQEGFCTR